MTQAARLLDMLPAWAAARPEITGILLLGSHARGQARADSDLDLLILSQHKDKLLEDPSWTGHFGAVRSMAREEWGAVTSLRIFYEGRLEVEFAIARPDWARLDLDPGTRQVLQGGAKVVWDPHGILVELMDLCLPEAS